MSVRTYPVVFLRVGYTCRYSAPVHHQASVESSDEEQQEWGDPPMSPSSLPHSPSPSRAASLPHPFSSHSATTPHILPAVHLPPEEKKKKKRFLFRRKKKGRTGSLKAPSRASPDTINSFDSDSGTSFTDILVDPSLVHRKASGSRLMSLPTEALQRSVSDSAVSAVLVVVCGVGSALWTVLYCVRFTEWGWTWK